MSTINPQNIILGPIVTEKSLANQSRGVYSFWVGQNANKRQIADAFKIVFGIKALSIRTTHVSGKVKTDPRKRLPIQKPDRKKALITVPKDTKIESLNLNTK